jgi:hypothetical protein
MAVDRHHFFPRSSDGDCIKINDMKNRVAALMFMFVISTCEGQVHTEANAQHNAGMSLEDRQQRESPVGLDAWQLKYVGSPVDFRYAARVATPAVMHINATWNSVTEDNPVWERINLFHNLLKIDEKDLIFIKFGNSDNVEVGELKVLF